jgi:hypothetical protein
VTWASEEEPKEAGRWPEMAPVVAVWAGRGTDRRRRAQRGAPQRGEMRRGVGCIDTPLGMGSDQEGSGIVGINALDRPGLPDGPLR